MEDSSSTCSTEEPWRGSPLAKSLCDNSIRPIPSGSVNPSEATKMDSGNGAVLRNIMLEQSVELGFCKERLSELLQRLNSSEAEVSRYKAQLDLCREKENNYEDALSKATAQVDEKQENLRDREKKYEDALSKVRQKAALNISCYHTSCVERQL